MTWISFEAFGQRRFVKSRMNQSSAESVNKQAMITLQEMMYHFATLKIEYWFDYIV